jgi:hypothetical protein
VGWAIDGANRFDVNLFGLTVGDVAWAGLLVEVDALHLDRGCDYSMIRAQLEVVGLDDLNIQRRRPRGALSVKLLMRFGLWWVVEGTNSWLSDYGQLGRNTDRRNERRDA